MTYRPKDQSLPLIIGQNAADGTPADVVHALIGYVDTLAVGGYDKDSLPDTYHDLYELDRLIGEHMNGGIRQYVGNTRARGDDIQTLLVQCSRAATQIGVPDLAAIAKDLAMWLAANPQDAAKISAVEPHPQMADFDDRLDALEFDDAGLATYLGSLPDAQSDWLRARVQHPASDKAAAQAAQTAIEELPRKGPENAARIACAPLADILRENLGAESSARKLETRMNILPQYVVQEMKTDQPPATMQARLVKVLQREIYPRLMFERSKYQLAASLWVRFHPNLVIAPQDKRAEMVARILAESPFADGEKAARNLDRLRDAIPGDHAIALSDALPRSFLGVMGNKPLIDTMVQGFEWGVEAQAERGVRVKIAGHDRLARRVGDEIWLHEMAKPQPLARRQERANALNRAGKTQEAMAALREDMQPRPGRRIGRGKIDPDVRKLALDLGLSEVLGILTDEGPLENSRFMHIPLGVLDRADKAKRTMSWRFAFKAIVLQIDIGPDGATVRQSDQPSPRRISAAEIATYRAAHTRDPALGR
jgi:hypothetical protein